MPNRQMPMNGVGSSTGGNKNKAGELCVNKSNAEPIYQNVDDEYKKSEMVLMEPHYQVPRSREPYYEMPKKSVPIPLYENVELMFPASSTDSSRFSMAESNESFGIDDGTEMVFPIDQSKYLNQAPPSEKPPPPPMQPPPPLPEDASLSNQSQVVVDNFKRINSTKRIKKEIHNKRSSFLGIEGQDFDNLELSVVPPPNIQAILQEEKRLEKQLYQKVGLYENSLNGK
jgi:F-box protein 20